jgi:hypothetical protein
MPSALLRKTKKAARPLLDGDHVQHEETAKRPKHKSAEERRLEELLFGNVVDAHVGDSQADRGEVRCYSCAVITAYFYEPGNKVSDLVMACLVA